MNANQIGKMFEKLENIEKTLREILIGKYEISDQPLTMKEACSFLKINYHTLKKYRDQGKIKAKKMGGGKDKPGGRIIILKSELMKFIEP